MFVIYEPSLYDHGLYLLIGNLSGKLYRVTEGMSFVRPIAWIFKAVSVFSAIDTKNSHYFSVNVIQYESTNSGHYFTSPTGNGTAILRGHSSHAKV